MRSIEFNPQMPRVNPIETELDQVIATALKSQGNTSDVNRVYLTLLRSLLFLPVTKNPTANSSEPFQPLFARVNDAYFMLAFDTLERLTQWAGEEWDKMSYVTLSAKDLIAGINENVFLGLNIGTEFYKEFSPPEVMHLKKILIKIEGMNSA